MAVARVTAIAGFAATSNVEAARRFGLRAAGTMAHSYIEAFPSEAEAFRVFAADHPDRLTFLVDTYDTLRGVRTAIDVIHELDLQGPLAVRLDSGDLAELAVETRRLLDEAGLPHATHGVPIDAAGVGTKMGVSADAPYLDSAYKIVAFGPRPVLKLSPGKRTLPAAKQVWRRHPIVEDVLGLRDEDPPAGFEPLLVPVMRDGVRVGEADSIEAARVRCARDVDALPEPARRLRAPVAPTVRVSDALESLARTTAEATVGSGR
jgi:nicotinate phosphoribosyltransferase